MGALLGESRSAVLRDEKASYDAQARELDGRRLLWVSAGAGNALRSRRCVAALPRSA